MFELSVIFFGLRLVQHRAVMALLALIEAKKSYVRYISHELRTPLSAANSGLQMLHAELTVTASTNPVDAERLDTLTDVCSAIQTTVDILNDLLTFEKMESGKNYHTLSHSLF
jgi:signal transduction histidine kinase